MDTTLATGITVPQPGRGDGPADVIVGGVTARPGDFDPRKYGFDVFLPVNRGIDWAPPLVRGFFDAVWATGEQVAGGIFQNNKKNLLSDLSKIGSIGTLEVHSQGSITFGNLHREIDQALQNSSLKIDKVVFAGAFPNQKMLRVLEKHGIEYAINTAMPFGQVPRLEGEYDDPIGLITMPNRVLGETLLPNALPVAQLDTGWIVGGLGKAGALLAALPVIPGPYSFGAHSLEHIHARGTETGSAVSQLRDVFYRGDDRRRTLFPPDLAGWWWGRRWSMGGARVRRRIP